MAFRTREITSHAFMLPIAALSVVCGEFIRLFVATLRALCARDNNKVELNFISISHSMLEVFLFDLISLNVILVKNRFYLSSMCDLSSICFPSNTSGPKTRTQHQNLMAFHHQTHVESKGGSSKERKWTKINFEDFVFQAAHNDYWQWTLRLVFIDFFDRKDRDGPDDGEEKKTICRSPKNKAQCSVRPFDLISSSFSLHIFLSGKSYLNYWWDVTRPTH